MKKTMSIALITLGIILIIIGIITLNQKKEIQVQPQIQIPSVQAEKEIQKTFDYISSEMNRGTSVLKQIK